MNRGDWDRRYSGSELIWTAEPNRFVAEEVSALPAGRALDLACGEGRNAVWLASRGWRVDAVDFSSVALEKAARRLRPVETADGPATAIDCLVRALRRQAPESPA